jgi:DNA-binding beta-propeller fold protein YncE
VAAFDLSGGRFLFSFGGEGTGEGQLYAPQGLAIDPDGHVFVAEMLNTRVQEFDADGNYLNSFGKRGDKFYHFEGPKDLAFDSDGNLHILDVRKAALIIYKTDGTLLLYTGGSPTKNPLGFAMPVGLWIDKNDTIYISDSMNRRFSIWRYFSEEFIRQNPGEFEKL